MVPLRSLSISCMTTASISRHSLNTVALLHYLYISRCYLPLPMHNVEVSRDFRSDEFADEDQTEDNFKRT